MAYINACTDRESLGAGRFRNTAWVKPVAYDRAGSWRTINNDWTDNDLHAGGLHQVRTAPFFCSVSEGGMRRLHPTREAGKYIEIGRPWVKVGGAWQAAPINALERNGSRLISTNTNYNLYLDMAGHYVKLAILLKGGFVPEDRLVAFPVGIQGLTRQGGNILDEGKAVMALSPPVVYDHANEDDRRAIEWEFASVNGQPHLIFTLPDLSGMAQPVIDPTFTSPQDGEGKDAPIRSLLATTNYGSSADLNVGDSDVAADIWRTLIFFDLTSIPTAATVISASLSLWLSYIGSHAASNNRTLKIYHVDSDRDWVEGEATWTIWKTDSNWTTAGCGSVGNDYNSSSVAEHAMVAVGTPDAANSEHAFPFTDLTLLQTAISTPATNQGILLRAETESDDKYLFHSSDGGTSAYYPQLTVEYTLPTTGVIIF